MARKVPRKIAKVTGFTFFLSSFVRQQRHVIRFKAFLSLVWILSNQHHDVNENGGRQLVYGQNISSASASLLI